MSGDPRLNLVDAIYQGSLDGCWGEFVQRLSKEFRSRVAFRVTGATRAQVRTAHETFDPDYVPAYSYYAARDPWLARGPATFRDSWSRRPVVFTDELIERSVTERSEFYADWLRPQGLSHGARCRLETRDHEVLDLVLAREAGAPEFSERDRGVLQDLLPHLKRSVSIAEKLEGLASDVTPENSSRRS